MEVRTFFFDTYALYEIIEGNKNYRSYIKNVAIVTTKLNLMELYYGLLVNYNEKTANDLYDKFLSYYTSINII